MACVNSGDAGRTPSEPGQFQYHPIWSIPRRTWRVLGQIHSVLACSIGGLSGSRIACLKSGAEFGKGFDDDRRFRLGVWRGCRCMGRRAGLVVLGQRSSPPTSEPPSQTSGLRSRTSPWRSRTKLLDPGHGLARVRPIGGADAGWPNIGKDRPEFDRIWPEFGPDSPKHETGAAELRPIWVGLDQSPVRSTEV